MKTQQVLPELEDGDAWLSGAIRAIQRRRMSAIPPQPQDSDDRPSMRAHRHAFQPPLQFGFDAETEPYLKEVTQMLSIYNHSTLQRFCNPLRVSGLIHEPRTINGSEARYFAFGRNEFMVKVPVILENSSSQIKEVQTRSIMIVNGETTCSLEEWIRSLPPLAPTPLGEAGFRMLHKWHLDSRFYRRRPAKSFNDMPDDIKSDILLHMVGAVRPLTRPYMRPDFNITSGDEHGDSVVGNWNFRKILISSLRPRIPAVNLEILLLNKETHDLVKPVIRSATIKSFDVPSYILHTITWAPQHPGRESFLTNLTRVQLAFTDFAYLFFFQVELPGVDMDELAKKTTHHHANATVLRKLPTLKYLELWFNSPLDPIACSPWYATKEAAYQFATPFNVARFPCRKTMIDWILTAAFPFIEHIPHLNITGFVKSCTREHWLSVYQSSSESDRANQLAKNEQKLEEIKYLGPDQVPPPCFCPTSCYYPDLIRIHHDYYKERRREKKKYPKTILGPDPAEEAVKRYRFDFDDDFTAEDRKQVFETTKFPRYFRQIPSCSVVEYRAPNFRRYRD